MQFRSAFIKNITVLNIILIAATVISANYVFLPLFDIKIATLPAAAKKPAEETTEKAVNKQPASLLEYAIIADKNLFHPLRTIVAAKDVKPEIKPEFVLYGTLITGNTRMAFLEDMRSQYSTPGRGKRQKALALGGTLSGYILSEVHPDRIVMVKDNDRMELKVINASKPKARTSGKVNPK